MGGLNAAIGVVDITPTDFPDIRLGGFGLNRRARGVLHPLEAGVSYFASGDEYVVLVTMDSVGIGLPWIERIRDAVTTLPDKSRIIVCATHAHSVPDTLGYWGKSLLGVLPRSSGVNPEYMAQIVRDIAAGIDEAVTKAAPARLRVTEFEIPPGLVTNHREGGALDPRGVMLRIDGEDDTPLGCLVNFACHPEGLWDKNRLVSPDFPHHTRAVMRERGLGHPLFFNGALGGMLTPNIPIKTGAQERQTEVERIGRALGELAAAAAEAAPVVPIKGLQLVSTPVYLPFTNWRFRLIEKLRVISRSQTDGEVRTEMHLVRLNAEAGGDGLQMLSIPGEPLPELGQELRRVLDGGPTMILGLGCDELGYMLPDEQFNSREYSYEKSMSLGPETATLLLGAAKRLAAAPPDTRWAR